jgi:thiamine transport system permease protein
VTGAFLVVGGILALVGAAFAGLASVADGIGGVRPDAVLSVVRFTAVQAGLSTLLSLVLGALIALALARRRFPGRGLYLAGLGAATALPAIIVVFALAAIWGRAGVLNDALAAMDLPRLSIYGLPGVVLAHVFFNAPFAARAYLAAIERTPGEHWRLAASLGMTPFAILRFIDGPAMALETPALGILIFLLCATSFAIPLSLGGGPGAATLEVAIYEALRFEVDFGKAAVLAALQIATLTGLSLLALPLLRRPIETAVVGRPVPRPDRDGAMLRLVDGAMILAGLLLVAPPLLAIGWSARALPEVFDTAILHATATSFAVALPSASLAVLSAYALAKGRAAAGRGGVLLGQVPLMALAMPPLALAAGLYVLVRAVADPATVALPALIVMNALMALPFAYRLIEPPVLLAEARYGRLAQSLGMSGLSRLRLIERPLLAAPAAAAFALAAALSLGDLGVIALFGADSLKTLPYLLFERLGSYRMAQGEAIAAVLTLLVLAMMALARLAGRSDARAA